MCCTDTFECNEQKNESGRVLLHSKNVFHPDGENSQYLTLPLGNTFCEFIADPDHDKVIFSAFCREADSYKKYQTLPLALLRFFIKESPKDWIAIAQALFRSCTNDHWDPAWKSMRVYIPILCKVVGEHYSLGQSSNGEGYVESD